MLHKHHEIDPNNYLDKLHGHYRTMDGAAIGFRDYMMEKSWLSGERSIEWGSNIALNSDGTYGFYEPWPGLEGVVSMTYSIGITKAIIHYETHDTPDWNGRYHGMRPGPGQSGCDALTASLINHVLDDKAFRSYVVHESGGMERLNPNTDGDDRFYIFPPDYGFHFLYFLYQ